MAVALWLCSSHSHPPCHPRSLLCSTNVCLIVSFSNPQLHALRSCPIVTVCAQNYQKAHEALWRAPRTPPTPVCAADVQVCLRHKDSKLASKPVVPSHMQMSEPGEQEGLQTLLDSITSQTCPDAQHAAYHAKHLELLVQRMESQPTRLDST